MRWVVESLHQRQAGGWSMSEDLVPAQSQARVHSRGAGAVAVCHTDSDFDSSSNLDLWNWDSRWQDKVELGRCNGVGGVVAYLSGMLETADVPSLLILLLPLLLSTPLDSLLHSHIDTPVLHSRASASSVECLLPADMDATSDMSARANEMKRLEN